MEKNFAFTIEEKIKTSLGLINVEVVNNSHLHSHHSSSPKNGNSHFQITVCSNEMKGLSRIQIHKKIYSELKVEMNDYIHSLEITLRD
jgi:stress-induced morphogen